MEHMSTIPTIALILPRNMSYLAAAAPASSASRTKPSSEIGLKSGYSSRADRKPK